VWGSGPYTLDSKIELAAVHAGVVQPGETKVVRIRVVSPPPTFDAGNQNGVPTAAYGAYPAGAYIFVR
jgi:hypothetical protein